MTCFMNDLHYEEAGEEWDDVRGWDRQTRDLSGDIWEQYVLRFMSHTMSCIPEDGDGEGGERGISLFPIRWCFVATGASSNTLPPRLHSENIRYPAPTPIAKHPLSTPKV